MPPRFQTPGSAPDDCLISNQMEKGNEIVPTSWSSRVIYCMVLTQAFLLFSFWMSLKTMFWAVFGFADDTVFKTGSDVDNSAEVVVGTALYAVWCVIAIIVLLNMLIALINDSFQNVQARDK